MTRARDVASVLTTASTLATDTETAAAISSHNTAANGHVGRGTTANRPGSPAVGDLFYDTTINNLIRYNGTSWIEIAPVPNAPTDIVATSTGETSASITFTAPTNVSVSSYTVTSSPGNVTASGSSSPISITGLTGGTSYTFSIIAQGSNGNSQPAISNSITTISFPVVSGGTLYSDSTHYYRAFTSSGNLTVSNAPLTTDILVVAGGGGGSLSSASGGGAGAGGLLTFTNQNVSVATHAIVVGAGGVGCSSNNTGTVFQNPTNGNNSQFGNLTLVIGGGTGGGFGVGSNAGNSGGSGGGGATNSGVGGSGTAGQGNSGGTAGNGGAFWSGSGGGAGAAGSFGSGAVAGGIGATSSLITAMGNATGTGQLSGGNRYYAGGGGNSSNGAGGGAGGLGGGGAGATTNGVGGSAGQANTGGGAGAGPNATSTSQTSGNGGSGVVIVRYLKSDVGG